MQYTAHDINKFGTILGIWAHPDDETWSMAGVMLSALQQGQRVVVVTATRGEAGKTTDEQSWPQKDLGKIRIEELGQSLELLGVTEHHLLHYADGKLPETDETEAVKEISEIIKTVEPDSLFTFGPDGITGHEDHKTIRKWVMGANKGRLPIYQATEAKEKFEAIPEKCHELLNFYFNLHKKPSRKLGEMDVCYTLSNDELEKKLAALKLQASQYSLMFDSLIGCTFIEKQAATECFVLTR